MIEIMAKYEEQSDSCSPVLEFLTKVVSSLKEIQVWSLLFVMLNLRFQLNFDWVWFGLFKEVL